MCPAVVGNATHSPAGLPLRLRQGWRDTRLKSVRPFVHFFLSQSFDIWGAVGLIAETELPQEDELKSNGMGGLVVALIGGVALYFFKFKKSKADTKGGDELDEYDFGEDETN